MNKKYDPSQPRVPAGSSKGGQWTKREEAERIYNTVYPNDINVSKRAKEEKFTKTDEDSLYRKNVNPEPFSHLVESMSKKRIREIAKEYGIDMKGISIRIDKGIDNLRSCITGVANGSSVGEIIFLPNAFESKESLLRTLYHEKIHVEQFKKFGTEFVQNHQARFEKEAYEKEEAFIREQKEKGRL